MNGTTQRFLQFAHEPLLHWPIGVAMAVESRYEADGRESVLGHVFAVVVAAEDLSFRGVAVEVKNDGRFRYAFWPDHVQIDWIALTPLHLPQFTGELGIFIFFSKQWPFCYQLAVGQRERTPVLQVAHGTSAYRTRLLGPRRVRPPEIRPRLLSPPGRQACGQQKKQTREKVSTAASPPHLLHSILFRNIIHFSRFFPAEDPGVSNSRLNSAVNPDRPLLSKYSQRTESKNLAGSKLSDLGGQVLRLLSRLKHFQIRNLNHELHTSTPVSVHDLVTGGRLPNQADRLHIRRRSVLAPGLLLHADASSFDASSGTVILVALDRNHSAAHIAP